MELSALTIHEAGKGLAEKSFSSLELTRAVLDRIHTVEPQVDAYITICEESALEAAKKADERIRKGDSALLTGIPVAVKDLMCTKDILTTCGSGILENFIPPYDAHVIEILKDQDAVIIGKTNMDEFAMGSSTEHSAFKPTKNPWNTSRIPGGSSGGSAAAIAADMCIGAIGSDTGGSIRQPASHCGVVGIKPTYGRVSRYGLVAFASSLDQIGPFGKDVKDAALMLSAIAGHDKRDSTSMPVDVPDYSAFLGKSLKGIRVGIPKEYENARGLDPDVAKAVSDAVSVIASLGAEKVSVSLPRPEDAVSAYYVIAPSEASSNLARYDGVKYGFRSREAKDIIGMFQKTRSQGFGMEVQRRIIIGTYCLSAGYYDAYYGKASQVRTLIRREFEKVFEVCDVLLCPVAPTPAFAIGEKVDDPLTMYLQDVFTISANLAGIPGLSLPCGFSGENMPIGLQIMAGHFNEPVIFQVASAYEAETGMHRKKCSL